MYRTTCGDILVYGYSYNPLEGNTENYVLMKCETCGYEEAVPMKDIELLRSLNEAQYDGIDEDHLLCPFCLDMMYRKDSPRFTDNNQ